MSVIEGCCCQDSLYIRCFTNCIFRYVLSETVTFPCSMMFYLCEVNPSPVTCFCPCTVICLSNKPAPHISSSSAWPNQLVVTALWVSPCINRGVYYVWFCTVQSWWYMSKLDTGWPEILGMGIRLTNSWFRQVLDHFMMMTISWSCSSIHVYILWSKEVKMSGARLLILSSPHPSKKH